MPRQFSSHTLLLFATFLLCSLSSAIHPLFCSIRNITPIISTVKRRVLIFLWRFCDRYKPCIFTGKNLLQACLKRRFFSRKYIGWQPYSEGILSRAVHGVSRSFTGIFHVRLLCNMIVDIHIWMFFAPLRSGLNECFFLQIYNSEKNIFSTYLALSLLSTKY